MTRALGIVLIAAPLAVGVAGLGWILASLILGPDPGARLYGFGCLGLISLFTGIFLVAEWRP